MITAAGRVLQGYGFKIVGMVLSEKLFLGCGGYGFDSFGFWAFVNLSSAPCCNEVIWQPIKIIAAETESESGKAFEKQCFLERDLFDVFEK